MAVVNCDTINQTINQLLTAFQNCKKIDPADLTLLVELISAVRTCNDGGPLYNTMVQEIYEPISDEIVIYPVDTFHSISVMLVNGSMTQVIGPTTVTYPTGTVLNHEVTTLNQTAFTFTVKAGATVVVEYLIETI